MEWTRRRQLQQTPFCSGYPLLGTLAHCPTKRYFGKGSGFARNHKRDRSSNGFIWNVCGWP
eukprot:10578245-Alexandrium_andersonii.AAC.1